MNEKVLKQDEVKVARRIFLEPTPPFFRHTQRAKTFITLATIERAVPIEALIDKVTGATQTNSAIETKTMSELASPKPMKSQSVKESMNSSVNDKDDNKNNNTFHHPVTRSNGGAQPPNSKNSARGASIPTPNSAQKKKQGAIALAGLFNNGGEKEEEEDVGAVVVDPPVALEPIAEVVTLDSSSNSFETQDNAVDAAVATGKRKVGDISQEELPAPVMEYGGTEIGVVTALPPPSLPPPLPQQQQQKKGGDSSPKKKMRQSKESSAASSKPQQKTKAGGTTVVSTPQKVASILASQLPKTSVPPGVPMPRLPGVPQYLPPSSGKTSFEQLMQATTMTSPVPGAAPGHPVYRALPTQRSSAQRSMPYLNGQVPQQKQPEPPATATSSRKDKSLGVLCQSFMELYKDAPPNRDDNGAVVEIVEVAEHLGVKRRRIYDIINILESIDIVARVRKNTYRWHGTGDLPKFFAKLQRDAIEEQTRKANGTWVEDPNKPKTKGMATTCQKLLQIFLSTGQTDFPLAYAADLIMGPQEQAAEEASKVQATSLDPAPLPNPLAPVLPPIPLKEEAPVPPLDVPAIPDNDNTTTTTTEAAKTPAQKQMKTKVRRMYDIANVLQALGVLQKYNVGSTSQNNKPSLRWTFYLKPDEIAQYAANM